MEAHLREYQELRVPMMEGRCAIVPFPMTEEGFNLLLATIALWKPTLIAARERKKASKAVAAPRKVEVGAAAADALPAAPEAPESGDGNESVSPGSPEGVRIGRTLIEPFSPTDLRARLDGDPKRCYYWISSWQDRAWVTNTGFGSWRRTAAFGENA